VKRRTLVYMTAGEIRRAARNLDEREIDNATTVELWVATTPDTEQPGRTKFVGVMAAHGDDVALRLGAPR
jgi:hypothetical protein